MTVTARLKKKLYLGVARYFRFFANQSLHRWSPRVIAVTGSVGKTTLLNLLEVQLAGRAHYSHNANSSYGIAFDILGIDGVRGSKLKWLYLFMVVPLRALWFRHTEEFYVVEIDGERPKETAFLASWLRPEITLWVSVGRTHAVYFDGQVRAGLYETVEDAIVHEFAYLPKYTQRMVAYNAENALIVRTMNEISDVEKRPVSERVLTSYKVWPDKTELTVDGINYVFHQPMPREVYTQLALLGIVADYLGEKVITDLSTYVQPVGRSNYFAGKHGSQLIDSSYNAHLISMQSIIEMYEAMQAKRKWIVIGDVVEQGEGEADEHMKLGRLLRNADFERYILVGRRTQRYVYPELDSSKTVTFLHPKDAALYLDAELRKGTTVLFKGSQYLEGIIEYLLLNPRDAALLPRQEPAAKKRRAKWGLV